MQVIIIGGGASGLTAAIKARENNNEVIVIERNNTCGKKLLLTGNGRCNFWNENQDITKYYSDNMPKLKNIWESKKDEVLNFFDSIGIVPKNIDGYYYPYSKTSHSVLDALINKATKLGVIFKLEEKVLKVSKETKFTVLTTKSEYHSDIVIVATGGASYPKTGSDGNGYEIATSFNHKLTPLLPALVPLKGNANYYSLWAGLRCEAIATLYENDIKIWEEKGEIQFTNYGLSGICIFNLSGMVARGLAKGKKEVISLNLVPWHKGSKADLKNWLDKREKLLNGSLKEILEGFLNYKLVNLLLKIAKIPKEESWHNSDKEKIIELLTNFKFEVTATQNIEEAQVTEGGVSLDEIDENTMESLKVKGLYFIGEILDATGLCGGYNLGLAWITGLKVGEHLHD